MRVGRLSPTIRNFNRASGAVSESERFLDEALAPLPVFGARQAVTIAIHAGTRLTWGYYLEALTSRTPNRLYGWRVGGQVVFLFGNAGYSDDSIPWRLWCLICSALSWEHHVFNVLSEEVARGRAVS